MPPQERDGLVTLGVGGADGWSVLAQARSVYCDEGLDKA
jgi:hypothetical protein